MKNPTILALFLIVFITQTFSQQCNRNVIDCRGICGRMTDADGDSICDLSPRSVQTTVVQNSTDGQQSPIINENNSGETNKAISSKSIPHNPKPEIKCHTCEGCNGDCIEKSDTNAAKSLPEKVQPLAVNEVKAPTDTEIYPLIEISALTFGLYFITWLLAKLKVFKKSVHRKIWNIVLVITFLMSGVLGLVLVVQLNYNVLNDWYMSFLELHVDFGIAMGIISIFHILWHTKYFLTIFKKHKSVKA